MDSSASVVPLDLTGDADAAVVGGKARGLTVIARAGLPLPEGFVVTTAAHRAAMADAGAVPEQVAREVRRLVEQLGDVPLAVRSSASDEDGGDHSHAGQYLTRLGVRGPDQTLDAILACWASSVSERARAYRGRRGDEAEVAMAVVVQRLAHGEAAGVCMSVDPITGDPGIIVVNAAHGLGELVVNGEVTPDDYRLARDDGRLLAYDAGDMDVMLVMGADGPVQVPVPAGRRAARVLPDECLADLHAGVLECERALGRPADCEFSVVGGRVVWLQCRPMTALPAAAPTTPGGRTQAPAPR
jgi:pyruvate,water dikinase